MTSHSSPRGRCHGVQSTNSLPAVLQTCLAMCSMMTAYTSRKREKGGICIHRQWWC